MAFKVFLSFAILAAVSAVPVHKQYVSEHEAPAHYEFSYSVHDEHTGDIKSQQESREGDAVKGHYELIDSDGFKRIVEYTADDVHGFVAVVHREPTNIKIPLPAPTQYSHAPVAHYRPAPVAHYSPAPVVQHYSPAPVQHVSYAPKPVQHVQHVAPVQHVHHVAPVQHVQHATPVQHVQHFAPVQHVQHVAPVQHVQHVVPVQHAAPVHHVQHVTPVQHVQHVAPLQHAAPVHQYSHSAPVVASHQLNQAPDHVHFNAPGFNYNY